MASKLPVPELILDAVKWGNHPIFVEAKRVVTDVEAGKKIKLDEEIGRKAIVGQAESIVDSEANNDNFVGLLHLKSEELNLPVRVEMRMSGGALDATEEPTLEQHFGKDRPALFELTEVVDMITSPDDLLDTLVNAGVNPWDYLELRVKKDKDAVVIAKSGGTGITTAKAFLPKDGFLALLNRVVGRMSAEAKTYVKAYLKATLKPTVVVGSTKSTKE
jgi:hypothetical protein